MQHVAAGERPFELPNELLEVVLHHAIEVHQLAVHVVEHLDLGGRRPQEKKRSAAGERFDVALVRGEKPKNAIGQAALAAQPGNDEGCHWFVRMCYRCPRLYRWDGLGSLTAHSVGRLSVAQLQLRGRLRLLSNKNS
jgi:hypothetical protein